MNYIQEYKNLKENEINRLYFIIFLLSCAIIIKLIF